MKNLLEPGHRMEILTRIERIRPDSERRWGRMSPHQALCHLRDAFLIMLGDRQAADVSTVFTRTVLRLGAVTAPLRWPRGVPTMPEADQDADGTPPGDFQDDLDRLERSVDAFVERLDPVAMWHPLFGRMSRGEWGRWGYRHLDHHARQFGL